MDRRPREPRQLAGEYGISEHREERFDTGELSREWLFDADAEAVRSSEALDGPVNANRATSDVAFKPKCLGIETSIKRHPAKRRVSFPSPSRARNCGSIKAL